MQNEDIAQIDLYLFFYDHFLVNENLLFFDCAIDMPFKIDSVFDFNASDCILKLYREILLYDMSITP